MLRNKVLSLAVLAATVIIPVQAVFAASTPERTMVSYTGSNQKLIKFTMRNTGSAPLDLRLGDQTVTIAAGKTMEVKLPVGTRITTVSETPRTPAGTLILEVSSANSNTTVSIS